MSDRIALMRNGRIVQYGSPLDIYNRPAFKFVADFIGETSFIAGTVLNGGIVAQGARLLTESSLEVPTGAADCWIAARPEKIRFLDRVDPALNCFGGVVRDSLFRGDCTHVTIILSTGELVRVRGQAGTTSDRLPNRGDSVLLGIHPADTVVMFE
jgi:putative spermidine/putrescine transport system ATP-binding protein